MSKGEAVRMYLYLEEKVRMHIQEKVKRFNGRDDENVHIHVGDCEDVYGTGGKGASFF